MNAREQFTVRTLEWINARLAPPGVVVTAETKLFAEGIISSIKVLDLIAWTERAIGTEIEDKDIKLDNFRTVQRIAEVFAKEEHHAAA
jgi:acyl carrier protein